VLLSLIVRRRIGLFTPCKRKQENSMERGKFSPPPPVPVFVRKKDMAALSLYILDGREWIVERLGPSLKTMLNFRQ
jgi:hypothetical protein